MKSDITTANRALENLRNEEGNPLVSYWILKEFIRRVEITYSRRTPALLREREFED